MRTNHIWEPCKPQSQPQESYDFDPTIQNCARVSIIFRFFLSFFIFLRFCFAIPQSSILLLRFCGAIPVFHRSSLCDFFAISSLFLLWVLFYSWDFICSILLRLFFFVAISSLFLLWVLFYSCDFIWSIFDCSLIQFWGFVLWYTNFPSIFCDFSDFLRFLERSTTN